MWRIVLVVLITSMSAFYATSFDGITLVASQYSYRELKEGQEAGTRMKLFWAILLIMLPIALIFSEGSMNNLQTVSIIAAFPIGLVIILIIASFIKDGRKFIDNKEEAVDFYDDEVEINEDVTENEELELKMKNK
jgi:BCCT family betaine/carnitine transporter